MYVCLYMFFFLYMLIFVFQKKVEHDLFTFSADIRTAPSTFLPYMCLLNQIPLFNSNCFKSRSPFPIIHTHTAQHAHVHSITFGFSKTRGHTAERISLDCDSSTCRGTLTCLRPPNKTTAPGEEKFSWCSTAGSALPPT